MAPLHYQVGPLRGRHGGEECYIFGDGVSIKSFDLHHFNDKPAIAVGVMPHHVDFAKLDVRYWILPEPMFFWPAIHRGAYISRRHRKTFQDFFRPRHVLPKSVMSFLNVTNFPTGLFHNVRYVFDKFPRDRRFTHSSSSIDFFAGSINASLSLALYLGFSRAYLVGFDYTHEPATAGHWYETGMGIPQEFDSYNEEFFSWISQWMEVITVTPEQQQTRLASIDYQSLTGAVLSYRENSELLTQADMQALAMWPDYRIF
jgi:hypothetical protein